MVIFVGIVSIFYIALSVITVVKTQGAAKKMPRPIQSARSKLYQNVVSAESGVRIQPDRKLRPPTTFVARLRKDVSVGLPAHSKVLFAGVNAANRDSKGEDKRLIAERYATTVSSFQKTSHQTDIHSGTHQVEPRHNDEAFYGGHQKTFTRPSKFIH